MKKNKIIIPSKIKDVVPKPTKSQIIEALVARARIQHEEKEEEKRIKKNAIEEAMIANAVAFYAKNPSKAKPSVQYNGNVCFEISVRDAKNEALNKQRKKFESGYFYEDDVKKQICKKLATANPLLNNKEAEKHLDQLLASIMGQPNAIEAQEVEVLPPGE